VALTTLQLQVQRQFYELESVEVEVTETEMQEFEEEIEETVLEKDRTYPLVHLAVSEPPTSMGAAMLPRAISNFSAGISPVRIAIIAARKPSLQPLTSTSVSAVMFDMTGRCL
jgi:hypothetical protein